MYNITKIKFINTKLNINKNLMNRIKIRNKIKNYKTNGVICMDV